MCQFRPNNTAVLCPTVEKRPYSAYTSLQLYNSEFSELDQQFRRLNTLHTQVPLYTMNIFIDEPYNTVLHLQAGIYTSLNAMDFVFIR